MFDFKVLNATTQTVFLAIGAVFGGLTEGENVVQLPQHQ
jgi:hypothetical protein